MKVESEGIRMNTDKSGSIVAEKLPQLLFELSNQWRLAVLLAIKESSIRHTDISKSLEMSPQETTRHLLRLVEVRLIEKTVEGLYCLTNLGQLVLTFIPALDVVSKYSDFFLSHEISGIPYEYIVRLGELSKSAISKTDTLSTLNKAVEAIKTAKDQVWLMNVGRLEFIDSMLDDHHDVKLRCILSTEHASPPKEAITEKCRYLNEIKVSMILTSEIAAISLPDLDGKMDYSIFLGSKDQAFIKWCQDLFNHYWSKGRTIF